MLPDTKFICCADAGLGSVQHQEVQQHGRKGIQSVTQSVKNSAKYAEEGVFNDYGYRLLSDNSPITIRDMKTFDRHEKDNLGLYNDHAYKVIAADKVLDLGLYEDVALKNGRTVQRKAKGTLKQRIIITFSRKMMEYQRTIRNRQIERAKKAALHERPRGNQKRTQ